MITGVNPKALVPKVSSLLDTSHQKIIKTWTSDKLAEVEGANKVTVQGREKHSMVENISQRQPSEMNGKGSKGPKIITRYVQAS